MFGSCFGHQIIAYALGGKLETMTTVPSDRNKLIGRE